MKRFYVTERLLALGAKFDIYDEEMNNIFVAEADKFDIGKNISIYNNICTKVLYMRQQIRFGSNKYIVYNQEMREIAIIQKEFMMPKYNISGNIGNLEMKSTSILGREYDITNNGIVLGKISKEFTLGRDRYCVEVLNEKYDIFFIALAIMIDMVNFHKNNS